MATDRRRFLLSTLALGAGACVHPFPGYAFAASQRASVADFGADPTGARDATDAVRKAIASLSPAKARLVFPAGRYRFDTSSEAVLQFRDFNGIDIYANNAQLRFTGASPAFAFSSCSNVAIHDMHLDWSELPLSEQAQALSTTGFSFEHCQDILLEGLALRHTPGDGFVISHSRDVRLEDVTVAPPEDRRLSASTAGNAVTLQDCHGTIRVHDSRLEGMGGDGVHVQQSYWRIRERLNDKSVVIENNRGKPLEPWQLPQPGNFVQISAPDTLQLLGEIAIATVDIHQQGATLNFSETLSPVILSGMLVASVLDAPKTFIDHCVIGSNAGRGLVLHTRSEVTECHFHHCGQAAILLAADAARMDGPAVQNIGIRNNTFDACNQGPAADARGVITIDVMQVRAAPETPPFAVNSSIKIQANIFNGTAGAAIYAAGVDGLLVDGNTFGSNRKADTPAAQLPSALVLRNVADADITGNTSTVPQSILMLQCAETVATDGNRQLTARKAV